MGDGGCNHGGSSGGGSGSSSGGTGTGSSSGGSSPSAQPMLVDVDPNQTMNAAPGEGVGVFIEYKTGGHWNVWWTCDTNNTGLNCAFDNVVTVSTGTITNLTGEQLEASDAVTQDSPQKVEALTTTTTGVDGITFDTPFSSGQTPIITVQAQLSGVYSGQYFFFVQDGQINGGYTANPDHMLTDPLMLEPSSP